MKFNCQHFSAGLQKSRQFCRQKKNMRKYTTICDFGIFRGLFVVLVVHHQSIRPPPPPSEKVPAEFRSSQA